MKFYTTILPFLFVYLGSFFTNNSEEMPTTLDTNMAQCHETTQAFVAFAYIQRFLNIHEDPYSFDNSQAIGEMITYPVPDGAKATAYMVKATKPTNDYLVVIHEWYGLNNYVKNESDKFSKKYDQMNIIALDLYDGKVAQNSEQASQYMRAVKTERALAIINATQEFVGPEANIYTVGWCFGGGWSLQASIEMESQAKASVMFYGMPEKNLDRLKTLNCDVLAIFAEQDKWITPEVAIGFQADMANLENQLILKSYDADHGFANPSNPKYNQEAATKAYLEMFDFIAARR